MLNEKNVKLGKVRSCIRELFEYGKKRKAEIGEENVFDFSIGNPSVPAPKEVQTALSKLLCEDPVSLHGYTSAQGNFETRKAVSDHLNRTFSTSLNPDCIYMTCGASASLTISLNALCNAGDEVIIFAPYFPEYKVFIEHAGAKYVAVDGICGTFQPDLDKFARALSSKTKAVIINSPNNPSGVVYSEETVKSICRILDKHCEKTGNPVYLISDEPYRELIFDDGAKTSCVFNYYRRSLICYSYSKSLSLPGERIGYIAVNNRMEEFAEVYAGVLGAGRALGFVCAPVLFQKLIARVCGVTSDISIYKRSRDELCAALTEYGYTVVKPDGAFYLFVKALEDDAKKFSERAKKFELLVVPGDDFGVKGYVRISYCVPPEMIRKSFPAFKALAESYKIS